MTVPHRSSGPLPNMSTTRSYFSFCRISIILLGSYEHVSLTPNLDPITIFYDILIFNYTKLYSTMSNNRDCTTPVVLFPYRALFHFIGSIHDAPLHQMRYNGKLLHSLHRSFFGKQYNGLPLHMSITSCITSLSPPPLSNLHHASVPGAHIQAPSSSPFTFSSTLTVLTSSRPAYPTILSLPHCRSPPNVGLTFSTTHNRK